VVLSLAQKAALSVAIEGVRQRNAEQQQQSTQVILNDQNARATVAASATKSAGATKPKAAAKAKAATKPKSATKVPASTITPYLTSGDLLDTSAATAAAENAKSDANFAYAGAAANAKQQLGDIGRATVANVAGANDDAAARGIYDSGIRAGNVGMAQQAGVRQATDVATNLRLSAAQAIARRNAANTQLGDFMTGITARAAENGAALPVDPYSSAKAPGANVKGAATTRKLSTKKKVR
jgi:hypothetical protein